MSTWIQGESPLTGLVKLDSCRTRFVEIKASHAASSAVHVEESAVRNAMLSVFRVTDKEMPGYGEPPTSLWRRYAEFELLRNYLEVRPPAFEAVATDRYTTHANSKLLRGRFRVS